jgi:hypothetical protein
MKLGDKFWCANCGKQSKSLKEIVKCDCKPKKKGEKFIDTIPHIRISSSKIIATGK